MAFRYKAQAETNVQLTVAVCSLTDAQTHIAKRSVVLGQRPVQLLVESRKTAELVPDELSRAQVSLNTVRRHDSVELPLLPARPVSARSTADSQ